MDDVIEKKDDRLIVAKIENGTVIDHINAGMAPRVMEILGIKKGYPAVIAVLMNVDSHKYGKKDIIKIRDKELSTSEIDSISLVAPNSTINIIKNYEVVRKQHVQVPDEFHGLFKCPNPICITNCEKTATRFIVEKSDQTLLRCNYCERIFRPEEVI